MNDEPKEEINITIFDADVYIIYDYKAVDNTMKLTLEKGIQDKVNLTRASIEDKILDGIDLTNGKLNGCIFNGCSMIGVKFNGTRCANAEFNYVNMDKADISNQKLIDWRFKTSQLTNIDFGELDLTCCVFDGVDFTNSDLSKAKYELIQFRNCYMDGAKMNPDNK